VAAELALAALGGEACPCLQVLSATRARLGVEDLFLLWTEGAEPSVGTSQALERWARRVGRPPEPGGSTGSAAVRRAEERRSALLASLPLAFRRRLALGVFRSIGREPVPGLSTSHPGFEPIFSSLLTEAARSARAAAPGRSGTERDVRWRPLPADRAAGVEVRGRTLFLSVSPGWVADVWAWGVAVVDGWLVLEVVRRPSPDHLVVRALPPAAGLVALRCAAIRRVGDRWRVEDGAAGSSCTRRRLASATAFPS
jgi:hypothetical protein